MKLADIGAACAALMLWMVTPANAGEAVSYTLVPRSTVLQFCTACTEPASRPETLNGSS